MAYEEIQLGGTLVGECVGKAEAVEESGAIDQGTGCAAGIACALEYE